MSELVRTWQHLVTTCQIVGSSILSQLVRSRASVLRHGIARGWSSHEELEKAIMLMISLRSTEDHADDQMIRSTDDHADDIAQINGG